MGWGRGELSQALCVPDLADSFSFLGEKLTAVFSSSACLGKVEGHRKVTAGAGLKQQVPRGGHSLG